MKLGLGTVQLGLPYGIANTVGDLPLDDVMSILSCAQDGGIVHFDTAASYGGSESLLGYFFSEHPFPSAKVCTKIRPIPPQLAKKEVSAFFQEELVASIHRLGKPIDYLLFHNPLDLIDNSDWLAPVAEQFIQNSLVHKIGISAYYPTEIVSCLDIFPIQIVQVPYNVFDHRFGEPALVELLKRNNIEVHCRSIFLQGLLCLPKSRLPKHLLKATPWIVQYHELCAEACMTSEDIAMVYVRDLDFVSTFFVGCESTNQVQDNLRRYCTPSLPDSIRAKIDFLFRTVPENIIIPSKWETAP